MTTREPTDADAGPGAGRRRRARAGSTTRYTRAAVALAAALALPGAVAAALPMPAASASAGDGEAPLPPDPDSVVLDRSILDASGIDLPAAPLGSGDVAAGVAGPAEARDVGRLAVRTVHLAALGRSPLDLHRGYERAIRALGGEVLFACTSRACGGDISHGVGGWGDDARAGLLAAVLTYAIDAKAAVEGCGALVDRAVAVVVAVEPGAGPAGGRGTRGGSRDPVTGGPAGRVQDRAPAAAAAEPAPGTPRVYIHYAASDARGGALAEALAGRLREAGFTVAEIRVVPFAIGTAGVRYFHAGDRGAAQALLRTAAPSLAGDGHDPPARPPARPRDFTGYRPRPRPGILEVWLAGG